MRKLLAAGIAAFLLWPAVAGAELTPLEKAMRSLAARQKIAPASDTTTAAAAPRASAPAPRASSPAAAPNTATALAAPAGTTSAARADAEGTTLAGAALAPAAVPTDPLALTATATAEEILLAWSNTGTARKDFGGYLLTRAFGGGEAQRLGPPLAVSSYRDVSAAADVEYVYAVVLLDARGQTLAASWPAAIRLLPTLPPGAPKTFEAAVDDERVRLTWQAGERTSHDLKGVVLYRARADGSERVAFKTVPAAKTTAFDDGGVPGLDYAYSAASLDAWGNTGEACSAVTGHARGRARSGLGLMSTAYRGLGLGSGGLNGDIQFTYFIGTLYGEQDKALSTQSLYLDPISLWLLTADAKYALLAEDAYPVSLALGGKGSLQLFAGQQSETGGSFTLSAKSSFETLWGAYLAVSRSFGPWGVHGGYLYGTAGNAVTYLSKYMEPAATRHLAYLGWDFPIVRTMNASIEVLYPLDDRLQSKQHPFLINTHVDRLLNFDVSFLHWDQGWAFLGYFNLRFTVFPGEDR